MRTRPEIEETATALHDDTRDWFEHGGRLGELLLEVALDIRDQLATITERIGGDGLTSAGTIIGNLQEIEEAVCLIEPGDEDL